MEQAANIKNVFAMFYSASRRRLASALAARSALLRLTASAQGFGAMFRWLLLVFCRTTRVYNQKHAYCPVQAA
jgi:hypothetical protein